jgi:hypothetical protein
VGVSVAEARWQNPERLCEGSMNRLVIAFAAFTALGVLAYTTLPDERIRLMTFAILGLFAVKTWLHRRELVHRDREVGSGK